MDILITNIPWIVINLSLAAVPIVFAVMFLKVKRLLLKIILLFLFIIFVPNTLYIITDVLHFPGQFSSVDLMSKFFLIIQYLIFEALGIAAFILSVNIFEKIITKIKYLRRFTKPLIILLNIVIGFGMVMGRILRINSWDIFTNTEKVIYLSFYFLNAWQLIILTLVFSLIGILIYFTFKEYVIRIVSRLLPLSFKFFQ